MRLVRRSFPATLLALALVACGPDNAFGPNDKSVAGTWNGTWGDADGNSALIQLTLQQNGSSVTGSGTIVGGDLSESVSVTGSYKRPTFSLTLSISGYEPILFDGTLTSVTTMSGSLTGGVDGGLTLTRPSLQ